MGAAGRGLAPLLRGHSPAGAQFQCKLAQPPTSTPRLGCRICGKPVDALLSQGANLCTICALDVRVEAQDSPEWALSAVLGKLERAAWWPVERLRAWLIGRVVDRRIAAARERKEAAGA